MNTTTKVPKKQKTIMLDYELFLRIQDEAVETDRSFSYVINQKVAAGYEKKKLFNPKL